MKLVHALAAGLLLAAPLAQATVLTFHVDFGPVAAVTATGSGSATVTFDTETNELRYVGAFTGLSGLTTQSHFHCCTASPFVQGAGIAVDSPSLLGFPIGVQSESFDATVDLDDPANFNGFNGVDPPTGFLRANGGTAASATTAFIDGVLAGRAYMNIHTRTFPAGEIFGFLLVPEPSTYALIALGLVGIGAARRRRA